MEVRGAVNLLARMCSGGGGVNTGGVTSLLTPWFLHPWLLDVCEFGLVSELKLFTSASQTAVLHFNFSLVQNIFSAEKKKQ